MARAGPETLAGYSRMHYIGLAVGMAAARRFSVEGIVKASKFLYFFRLGDFTAAKSSST